MSLELSLPVPGTRARTPWRPDVSPRGSARGPVTRSMSPACPPCPHSLLGDKEIEEKRGKRSEIMMTIVS